jgi:hypothetical protein
MGVAQVVGPTKHETLNSNPSTFKKKNKEKKEKKISSYFSGFLVYKQIEKSFLH